MPRVTLQPSGEVVDVPDEASFLDAATMAGVTEVSCCGITAACGRCRVLVLDGEANVTPPDEFEAANLKRRRFLPGERFGCMCHVLGDVEVEVYE
jgi:adenylate cyclase